MTPLPQIWTTDVFGNLTAAIRAEHQKHARIRPLIPAAPPEPGAYGVVIDKISSDSGFVGSPGQDKDIANPTRMSVEVRLNTNELEDIELAETLVRRAARSLAHAEDVVLAFGQLAGPARANNTTPRLIGPVKVVRVAKKHGLFGHHSTASRAQSGNVGGIRFLDVARQANASLADGTASILGPFACITGRVGESDARDLIGSKTPARQVAAENSEIARYAYLAAVVPEINDKREELEHERESLKEESARVQRELEPLTSLKRKSAAAKEQIEKLNSTVNKFTKKEQAVEKKLQGLPQPYLCMFPQDPTFLDFVEVLPPTCSFRGFDHASGAAVMLIESSFVLRIKDDSGIARIWI